MEAHTQTYTQHVCVFALCTQREQKQVEEEKGEQRKKWIWSGVLTLRHTEVEVKVIRDTQLILLQNCADAISVTQMIECPALKSYKQHIKLWLCAL